MARGLKRLDFVYQMPKCAPAKRRYILSIAPDFRQHRVTSTRDGVLAYYPEASMNPACDRNVQCPECIGTIPSWHLTNQKATLKFSELVKRWPRRDFRSAFAKD